ncbi:DUF4136 domain-containing protein [Lunatimonas salinarum]|uniref:DUF4136 domain-containing protein n=1 Tax=Lunatimonas salinarum TaxID=1774590 RepID=UPI001ADF6885|nr:DUF4136 domain-containing protein [Lunatimonas salinarum]
MLFRLVFFIFVSIVLAGCSSVKIQVTERETDFHLDAYRSFDFYEIDASGDLGESYEGNLAFLKEEIAKHFVYRGLLRKSDNPEILVNIGVWVEEKTQTRETSLVSDPGTFNYIGQRRYTWKSETIEVETYKKGTVTVHLVDASKNAALWVATADEVLLKNPDRMRDRIVKGVEKLFELIP